jgi:hypothetical protein
MAIAHILLALLLVLVYGSFTLFDRSGVREEAKTKNGRIRIQDLALEAQSAIDALEMYEPAEAAENLVRLLRVLHEKIRFSDPASIPTLESEDNDLRVSVEELRRQIFDAAAAKNIEEVSAAISARISELSRAIDRRNTRLAGMK